MFFYCELCNEASQKWGDAKTKGEACLSGEVKESWESFNAKLQSIDIHIVPCGEMELFHQLNSLHGQKWVNRILESLAIGTTAELAAAREFIQRVIKL